MASFSQGIGLSILCLGVAVGLSGCGASEEELRLAKGEEIYNGTCKVCHAQGINGAPILGNRKMWGKRAPQGVDTLVEHAITGYGLMPAKGGNDALVEEDVRSVVLFMLSRLN